MAASRFVTSTGTRIHYLDSGGDDRGAPIVFVPGMTDLATDYSGVLGQFGRRAVVVELRGHGRSGVPSHGYGFEERCDDVGAVVDDLTGGPVHLVTFSRGTTYAVGWALRNPDRVLSLAIGDYVPAEIVPPAGAIDHLLDGSWRGSPVRGRLDEEAARRTFAAARSRSLWDELASLQPALLVVRSRERLLVDDEAWDRYARLFPRSRRIEFSDSPHDIFRADRSRYPRLVRAHIDAVDRSSAPRKVEDRGRPDSD